MKTLFGPFSQILTMSNLPSMGSISDEDLIVIYDGGVMVENETIIGVGKFHEIKKHCNNIHIKKNYQKGEVFMIPWKKQD